MFNYLVNNMMTIIVLIILLLIVFLAIRSIINDHKKGKHPVCGGTCSSCSGGCPHVINLPKKLS